MDFKEIQELIKLISKSNLTEFKMEDGDFKVSIRTKKYGRLKNIVSPQQQIIPVSASPMAPVAPAYAPPVNAPVAAPKAAEVPPSDAGESTDAAVQYIEVRSPIVGTFYRSSSPDKPPYLKVGDTVEVGQVVCIVEAMKLFNEIESEVSGKVVKVIANDASPVEYDQVLFLLDPEG